MEADPNAPPQKPIKGAPTGGAAALWAVLLGLGIGTAVGAALGVVLGFVAVSESYRIAGLGCDVDDHGPCLNALGSAALFLGVMPGAVLGGLIGGVTGMVLAERWLVRPRRLKRTR